MTTSRSNPELLRAYAESGSEAAFGELVTRHIDLIYSTAFRIVCDSHLAKDVSQTVLATLARDAVRLTKHPALVGWLHVTTRNIASQIVRTQSRRRNRELAAAALNNGSDCSSLWDEIAPHLDSALANLSEPDRDAVILRYFQNKPAHEMAVILGISDEAAQKRVSRAVKRMRNYLDNRGIAAGATGMTAIISANALQAAPLGLASVLSTTALTGTSVASLSVFQIIAMSTFQKTMIAAAVTILAGLGVYQTRQEPQLRPEAIIHDQEDRFSTELNNDSQQAPPQNPSRASHNNERLRRQNADLKRQKEAREAELAETKKALENAQSLSSATGEIMRKLASDDEIQVPESLREIAILSGQVSLKAHNFFQKWNGRIPEKGNPLAIEYEQELSALITDEAALVKSFKFLNKEPSMDENNPADMAQVHMMQLHGALDLSESQQSDLDAKLRRYSRELQYRKLGESNRPSTGVEAWENERAEFSRRGYAEIQGSLTPKQRDAFTRLYKPEEFLLGVNMGVVLRPK